VSLAGGSVVSLRLGRCRPQRRSAPIAVQASQHSPGGSSHSRLSHRDRVLLSCTDHLARGCTSCDVVVEQPLGRPDDASPDLRRTCCLARDLLTEAIEQDRDVAEVTIDPLS
jgi:hypothetical protein